MFFSGTKSDCSSVALGSGVYCEVRLNVEARLTIDSNYCRFFALLLISLNELREVVRCCEHRRHGVDPGQVQDSLSAGLPNRSHVGHAHVIY